MDRRRNTERGYKNKYEANRKHRECWLASVDEQELSNKYRRRIVSVGWRGVSR